MVLQGYIFGFLYAFICILAAFLLNRAGINKKVTRKIVHISIGFEWVILHHFFGAGYHFLAVCLTLTALLILEYRLRLVPALSSDSDNAPGTVYYGLAMSVMALISAFVPDMMLPFGIGVFATSVGDGVAGLLGQLIKRCNPKIFGKKTLLGTLSMLAFTALSTAALKWCFDMPLCLWQIILIAFFSASVELISVLGLDNITVTLGAAFLSYAFIYIPSITSYLVPIILMPLIIAFARGKEVLTRSGVLFATILGVLVSLAFGNEGFLVLLAFLLLSIIADKIKSAYKKKEGAFSDCSSTRGARQVVANGAVGAICALLYMITGSDAFAVIYVASIAEAFADTVASGIGILSKSTYDVFRFRKCEKGISGGMSLIGTASAFAAAMLIEALSVLLGMTDIKEALIISTVAFLGMFFDSLLGSLLQVKYKCTVCGKVTERREHCGETTEKCGGVSFINNDAVNIIANIFTALLVHLIVL